MESFLQLYCNYTAKQESPTLFHVWCAVGAVAACLGRRIWLDWGYEVLYPNHYIVLLSTSGKTRKTTATHLALELIHLAAPKVVYSPNKTSTERFVSDMASGVILHKVGDSIITETLPMIAFSGELSVLISSREKVAGITNILDECYTCPPSFKASTHVRGPEEIPEPCINLLASTTPVWLKKNIGDQLLEEGFFGRIIWVYQTEPKCRDMFPTLTQEEREMKIELVRMLKDYQHLNGEMILQPQAKEVYQAWYKGIKPSEESNLDAFVARIHHHALKLGMILSVTSGNFPYISADHASASIDMLSLIRSLLPDVLENVGNQPEIEGRAHVLALIRKEGKIDHSSLLKRLWYKKCTAASVRDAITYFMESRMITRTKEGKGYVYTYKGGHNE